jgi:F0F1-type ATP synthase membrane subunit b/b'
MESTRKEINSEFTAARREINREVETLKREVDNKIQKAMDNPLANK